MKHRTRCLLIAAGLYPFSGLFLSGTMADATLSDAEFMELCSTKTPAAIKEALRQGANVNAKDYKGWIPLMKAACINTAETVNLLIEAVANVSANDKLKGLDVLRLLTEQTKR